MPSGRAFGKWSPSSSSSHGLNKEKEKSLRPWRKKETVMKRFLLDKTLVMSLVLWSRSWKQQRNIHLITKQENHFKSSSSALCLKKICLIAQEGTKKPRSKGKHNAGTWRQESRKKNPEIFGPSSLFSSLPKDFKRWILLSSCLWHVFTHHSSWNLLKESDSKEKKKNPRVALEDFIHNVTASFFIAFSF